MAHGSQVPRGDAPERDEIAAALASALHGYLDHLTVERGVARNTLLSYRRDLARYVRFLTAAGVDDLPAVTESVVLAYVASLREPIDGSAPLAATSIARAVVAVRGWHKYLLAEGVAADDPSVDVHPPQPGKRLPKALSVDEVAAILKAARGDGPRGLRDAALLEFLYATGARISEAVGLDIDDVDVDARVVRLLGKGSKERIVPVGSFAADALDAYQVRGRPALVAGRSGGGSGTSALFLNIRGGRLSRQSAWQVLRDAAVRAGISETVSPHTLRHSFATHLILGGADVRSVQELLGHASVTTTQIYTLVTVDALREIYATAHPRAR